MYIHQTIQMPICPEAIIAGHLMTMETRQEMFGKVAGGSGSIKAEQYQRTQLVSGTKRECPKTTMRINARTNEMTEISQPMRNEDGFDYTEDFDGKQEYSSNTLWVNLK